MRPWMRVAVAGIGIALLAGCVVRPIKPYRARGVVYVGDAAAVQPVDANATVAGAGDAPLTAQAGTSADVTPDVRVAQAGLAAH